MQRVTGECLPCIPAQWELNDRTSISLSKHCRGPDIAFPVVTVGIASPFPLNPFNQSSNIFPVKGCFVKLISVQAIT